MDRWKGRVALVTGASAGIGAGIAELLVKRGMVVVGCARNIEPIQSLAETLKDQPGRLHATLCDLSKEADILAMFEQIKKEHGGVDVCVNNAGVSYVGGLLDQPTHEWRAMLDVNVLSICICTREAYKSMEERGVDDGQIIHINSVGGLAVSAVLKGDNFYAATKYAVTALTEGVRNELRAKGSHIRICSICPGLVETTFHNRSRGPEEAQKLYSSFKSLQPRDIAEAVEYVLASPAHVQIHQVVAYPTESPASLKE